MYLYYLQISKALPQSWFANLTGDSTLPQLQNFVRVLTSIASALNQVLISGNDSLRKGARYVHTCSNYDKIFPPFVKRLLSWTGIFLVVFCLTLRSFPFLSFYREGVKQITRILVNIHATEQAASLAVWHWLCKLLFHFICSLFFFFFVMSWILCIIVNKDIFIHVLCTLTCYISHCL